MKVGLVTFDFPPQYRRADVALRPTVVGSPLARLLEGRGVEVVAPLAQLATHDPGTAGGIRDGKMLTQTSLEFQVALYLAARDRLGALADDGVAGASIKCHYERSTTLHGCTACLLPAFLPFGVDAEGPRPTIPFACEGDLNGLAGLLLLHALNPGAPPLFGDLVAYRSDHVLLRNCGASAVYWAGRSDEPGGSLGRLSLGPNLHGKSGAAVHYETPRCDSLGPGRGGVTFLRFFREGGRLAALLGEGRVLAETPESRYADPWPYTRLALSSSTSLLFKAIPCNHGSIAEGARAREVEVCCAYAGIPVYRCDTDEGLQALLQDRRRRARQEGTWPA